MQPVQPRIIIKGDRVVFEMERQDGEREPHHVVAPEHYAMIHDPSGDRWPKCWLLVAPFTPSVRAATPEEIDGAPRYYLGRSYEAHVGKLKLPPRDLGLWKMEGPVHRIYYWRSGTRAPGPFQHPFGKRRVEMLFRKGPTPILFRRSSMFVLALGAGCVWDDRGIVWP